LDKRGLLQWLIDNTDKIEIKEIHPDGHNGTPTLLIEFSNWDIAETSPFESRDDCIIFE